MQNVISYISRGGHGPDSKNVLLETGIGLSTGRYICRYVQYIGIYSTCMEELAATMVRYEYCIPYTVHMYVHTVMMERLYTS